MGEGTTTVAVRDTPASRPKNVPWEEASRALVWEAEEAGALVMAVSKVLTADTTLVDCRVACCMAAGV